MNFNHHRNYKLKRNEVNFEEYSSIGLKILKIKTNTVHSSVKLNLMDFFNQYNLL